MGSYKNRKVKLKPWWVGACDIFLYLWFCLKETFLTFVFYVNVYWVEYTFRISILFYIKKHYFIHFYCLFLKSSKDFSVSLRWKLYKTHASQIRNKIYSWNTFIRISGPISEEKKHYAEDVFKTSWIHVLKTFWRHVLKAASRRLGDKQNVYRGYLYLTNLNTYLANLLVTNLYLTNLRQIQNH